MDTSASTLIPVNRQESLVAWFELYMAIEAGPKDTNTFKAKKRDLQEFINYLHTAAGTDHPDQWTRSITQGFLKYLQKERKLAPTSINRVLATLKHAASWIHQQRPFLAGYPCDRVQEITVEDPEWKGLEDLQINRLKSAAEQLLHLNTRANQNPIRDYAVLLVLLHTAPARLRAAFAGPRSIPRQIPGKHSAQGQESRRGKLLLAKPVRDALDRYLDEVRGREPGPLIQSQSGGPWRRRTSTMPSSRSLPRPTSALPRASAFTSRRTCSGIRRYARRPKRKTSGTP